jgi:hypothetical protein
LDKDATLKAGVTLEDAILASLIVNDGVVFTVDGILISTQNMQINGTIRINGTATFKDNAAATFGPSGAIDIMANGVLTVTGATISGAPGAGAINVAGKLAAETGAIISAGYISVTGEVNNSGTITAIDKLVIGAIPTLSSGYVNSAKINGTITLGTNATAYVYGTLAVSKNLVAEGAGVLADTQYIIGDTYVYVTLYAAGQKLVMIDDELLDIIFLNWWENREFRAGDWNVLQGGGAKAFGPGDALIGEFAKIYAEFKWRTFEVTFGFTRGADWIVNGVNLGSSGSATYNYGTKLTVTVDVQPGYEGNPVLRANGASFTNPYPVVSDTSFTVSGVQTAKTGGGDSGGLTLIEILLIIIVIIIGIIAIIVAIRLMRS